MYLYFKNHFGMVVSTIIALVLSICMSSAAIITGPVEFSIELLIRNWGTAFLTIMLISVLLPVKKWGDMFAAAVKLKPRTLPFGLVSNIIPTIFYNTGATLVLVGVNMGFSNAHYMQAVIGDWPLMFVISYVLSMIAESIAVNVAMRCAPPAAIRRDDASAEVEPS